MEIRFQTSPAETKQMDTAQLRQNFLVQQLMKDDAVTLVYSHYDRVIIGGVKPLGKMLALPNHPELRADYFLERRELGVINVGGPGKVVTGCRFQVTGFRFQVIGFRGCKLAFHVSLFTFDASYSRFYPIPGCRVFAKNLT